MGANQKNNRLKQHCLKNFLLTVTILFFTLQAQAQKQGNIWYFGQYAGLDFNQSPVVALTDGQLNTIEGCATIADANGKLLFYTDGKQIWNRGQSLMKNGTGLLGHESATQSGVIVPAANGLFYVFTVGELGGQMNYSTVDIAGDNGMGEVISKNNLLLSLSTEKITAVRHSNGIDNWVVGHEWESSKFYAWLVTKDGVSSQPVVSEAGTFEGGDPGGAGGYMKISPDGTKLALATNQDDAYVEVYDFDPTTGKISSPQKLAGFHNEGGPYGIEFSPDGNLVYVVDNTSSFAGEVYQVKLPFTSSPVSQQGTVITKLVEAGALQLAPDGKIYLAQYNVGYLHAINSPNTPGTGCDFQLNAVYLGGKKSMLGLPTFNQSYFLSLSFSNSTNCYTAPIEFSASSNVENPEKITWDFGDLASGAANTANGKTSKHQYNAPGPYTVTVTLLNNGKNKTYSHVIKLSEPPKVDLGPEVTLFYGEQKILDAGDIAGNSYEWNDGSSDSILTVKSPGIYTVKVTSPNGCSSSASVKINYDQLINVSLPAAHTICDGEVYRLDVTLPGASYQWSTGSTDPFINVSESGVYKVKITNAYGNRTQDASITITKKAFNPVIADNQIIICSQGTATLHAKGAVGAEFYNWYDSGKNFIVQNDGTFQTTYLNTDASYFVALTDGTCIGTLKQIDVLIKKPVAVIFNGNSLIINKGESVVLNGAGGLIFQWQPASGLNAPASANTIASPEYTTHYTLTVTDVNGCTDTTGIEVNVKSDLIIPNTFTPNGDGVNDTWYIKNVQYTQNRTQVFNRYGDVVYAVNNYDNTWDGTQNGKKLPAGVYYYLINVRDGKTFKGWVTIIR